MTLSCRGSLLAVALGTIALGACSASPTAISAGTATASAAPAPARAVPTQSASAVPGDAAVRKAILSMVPGVQIDGLRTSPIAGLMEVNVAGQTVYVTTDGKYLLSGSLIDIASKRNLTEASRAVERRGAFKTLNPSQMIVFAPSHPKYTVTVFTDVDCGYCRKLHSQIVDYNRAGIAVDYLFFPRDGLGSESFNKAVSVWCASDRRQAFTEAKKGMNVPKANCANPVTSDYNLGLRVGVDGTPAIFTADGTQIGGYLSPSEMRAKLDELAAKPNS
jgi:thiol:disulfide interchange protein DsbC